MAQNFDLVIIGMGSGGLTAARLAAELDLRVAAIERDRIGGDCLWTGCVPSKALLASARVAHHMRTADAYGLDAVEPTIERARVWSRIHEIRNEIARTDDNAATYEGLGIRVIQGEARVRGPQSVEVNGQTLETRYILVATGSRPAIPPIPGLEDSGYLTSETLFELDEPPGSVFIIGGGPIAVELSQALRRLGCEVVIGEVLPRLLSREEPDLADRLTS
ncbi:MAG: FAD-dependent oxidoreductase, partial [Gaiellales bacterium]